LGNELGLFIAKTYDKNIFLRARHLGCKTPVVACCNKILWVLNWGAKEFSFCALTRTKFLAMPLSIGSDQAHFQCQNRSGLSKAITAVLQALLKDH